MICNKDMLEEIRNSTAVILGVSAGACNMAKRSLDIWESPEPYDGLGLVDITMKALFLSKKIRLRLQEKFFG